MLLGLWLSLFVWLSVSLADVSVEAPERAVPELAVPTAGLDARQLAGIQESLQEGLQELPPASVRLDGGMSRAKSEHPAHLDTALAYVGVTERGGSNRGPEVDKWLAHVNLNPGYAWCAAFVSYVLDAAGASYPPTRSARSRDFFLNGSIKTRHFLQTNSLPPLGALAVYRHTRYTGHVGIVSANLPPEGTSVPRIRAVSGNTSNPGGGPDGAFEKVRRLVPGGYMTPAAFTPVFYN